MIRVLLADDEEMVRDALASLLDREADIEVVATAGDGAAAVRLALAHRVDVAVVDLQMPVVDGLGVVAELARALPGCPVVVLTGHDAPLEGAAITAKYFHGPSVGAPLLCLTQSDPLPATASRTLRRGIRT